MSGAANARSITIGGRPIPYRVVRTPRARVIRIRVGPAGVLVTAPARAREGSITAALRHHSAWLLQTLDARPAPVVLTPGDRLPYLDGTRTVGADIPIDPACGAAASVEAWYRAEARRHLTARVTDWAACLGVEVARVTVRGQRSRWGSASATGTVSLNWRLMTTPSAVVEYVVVHEVAHLVRMDHSPEFWALVALHRPTYREERGWLRRHGAAVLEGPAPLPAA